MTNLRFIGTDADWAEYETALREACADLPVDLRRDHEAEHTDFIVMAGSRMIEDFTPFTRCRALLRLWAGVEDIAQNPTITFPICRMVGGGLDQGMVEWVTAHVLRHHIGMDGHLHGQDGIWRGGIVPPLASERPVTILGLGALGTACASALAGLGFPVTGWSRRPKTLPHIRCLNGPVEQALENAQIVVLLMPLTAETENMINAHTLRCTAKGAVLINPGRGPLIDDDALLAALGSGQIAHATLDVFRTEPLPANHPFWAHEQITVTPHIASATRPHIAAEVIADNIRRSLQGKPLRHMVDRSSGY